MDRRRGLGGFLNSLSGRFLLVTLAFVMLAEVLILVPSVARYRADYLLLRLEKAQIAALAALASPDAVSPDLEKELLANAGVYNVVLRRDEVRQLVLSSTIPEPIHGTYDLRLAGPWQLIRDAAAVLLDPQPRVIRVIGVPVQSAGLLIEITLATGDMRRAMIDNGLQILIMSALISAVTAILLFFAVRRLMVVPIRRVVRHMQAYAEAPEDVRHVIAPNARIEELRIAEEALQSMQQQLTGALRQKERLAQLGSAVAKISHDLRNILTTAQLFADRMEGSADPAVARSAPKLVASISRAVSLCESTLAFGKAEEPPPQLRRFPLRRLVADVAEGEGLAADSPIACLIDVPAGLTIRADSEQLYRVLSNLVRNARQAIEAVGETGTIEIGAGEDEEDWWIRVGDTGPGLPPKARDHLFAAFQGSVRKGGTGLGLTIAAELVRGHGGRLDLARTGEDGTEFEIRLPKSHETQAEGDEVVLRGAAMSRLGARGEAANAVPRLVAEGPQAAGTQKAVQRAPDGEPGRDVAKSAPLRSVPLGGGWTLPDGDRPLDASGEVTDAPSDRVTESQGKDSRVEDLRGEDSGAKGAGAEDSADESTDSPRRGARGKGRAPSASPRATRGDAERQSSSAKGGAKGRGDKPKE